MKYRLEMRGHDLEQNSLCRCIIKDCLLSRELSPEVADANAINHGEHHALQATVDSEKNGLPLRYTLWSVCRVSETGKLTPVYNNGAKL